jgi:iron complex transport system ATP-binding protein
VSFDAHPGEFLIVVGPNGAGKTTLLKAIAGLIAFTGRVSWNGKPITELRPAERAKIIAYLPQGHTAAWPIKARDVVAIGRAPFTSSLSRLGEADNAAIDRALDAVEAAQFASRPVTELSGGERARVMLARALAAGAPLLLADEPVASLDPAHQLSVMSVLASEAKRGRLVIGVSHDLMLAARFASRILVLSENKIAALGTPEQTLTAELLRRVFNVDALPLKAETQSINIPWMTATADPAISSKP